MSCSAVENKIEVDVHPARTRHGCTTWCGYIYYVRGSVREVVVYFHLKNSGETITSVDCGINSPLACDLFISIFFPQCHRATSLRQFFQSVPSSDPPVLALLGSGCSVATEPVAEIIHHWNISQVTIIIQQEHLFPVCTASTMSCFGLHVCACPIFSYGSLL